MLTSKIKKMFQPGGVSTNPHGYAQGTVQPYNSGLGLLAQMQMLKGFEGSGSYSSSSSKVKIVKYDDEFGKGWCVRNLKKPLPSSAAAGTAPGTFTEDEIKKNPPLALKFGDKDCNVLIPIPSHEAMCATTKTMLSEYLGAQANIMTDDQKKKASIRISKALLVNYVSKCNHSDQKLTPACFAADELGKRVPVQSRQEAFEDYRKIPGNQNVTGATYDTTPNAVAENFKDNINAWM